jgi:polysaccharide biosynthesis/export protein
MLPRAKWMGRVRQWARYGAIVVCGSGVIGCAPALSSVALRDWQAPVPTDTTTADVIGVGDLVAVQVWKADQMSTRQRVRTDGTVSLFFIGDLPVVGLTATAVAQRVADGLKDVLVAPRVSVVIEERVANVVTVLGEIVHPGTFPIRRDVTILEAIAMSGGLTEFARKDRLMVVRQGPSVSRIRVRFDDLLNGDDVARGLRLRPGDLLVVP